MRVFFGINMVRRIALGSGESGRKQANYDESEAHLFFFCFFSSQPYPTLP